MIGTSLSEWNPLKNIQTWQPSLGYLCWVWWMKCEAIVGIVQLQQKQDTKDGCACLLLYEQRQEKSAGIYFFGERQPKEDIIANPMQINIKRTVETPGNTWKYDEI